MLMTLQRITLSLRRLWQGKGARSKHSPWPTVMKPY